MGDLSRIGRDKRDRVAGRDNRPGVLGTLIRWRGAVAYLVALRLFEPAARPSGTPHITNPTRLWVRLAAAWLAVSVGMGLLFAAREALRDAPASFLEASAQRHALAMGFCCRCWWGWPGGCCPTSPAT